MDVLRSTDDEWKWLYEKYGKPQTEQPENTEEKNEETPTEKPVKKFNIKKFKWVFLVVIICVWLIFFYVFFLPHSITKPNIKNPRLTGDPNAYQKFLNEGNVTNNDIAYLANEIGAYRLMPDIISGEKPEIELVLNDTEQTFNIVVDNNFPVASSGPAKNPDIRVFGDKEAVAKILFIDSSLINSVIVDLYKNDKVAVVLLKSQEVLISKGYKAIYDEIQPMTL